MYENVDHFKSHHHTHIFHFSLRDVLNYCIAKGHADVFMWFLFFFFSQQTEVTSPADSEDRTPGRLQAVWPPPKPKDEEEKVGLKYTEAGEDLEFIAPPK